MSNEIIYNSILQSDAFIFINAGQTIYYSTYSRQKTDLPILRPMSVFLQNLFENKKDQSFFILRNKIYHSLNLNEYEKACIKLLAKRQIKINHDEASIILNEIFKKNQTCNYQEIKYNLNFEDQKFSLVNIENKSIQLTDHHNIYQMLTQPFLNITRNASFHDNHRNISAIAADVTGVIIGQTINTAMNNKSLHAEVNLIQNLIFTKTHLTSSVKNIYITDKPCQMCAGLIYEFINYYNLEIKIYYFNNVHGIRSKNTILDKTNYLFHIKI